MKIAISIISDPKAGEEALARVFNALSLAAESRAAGDQVEVSFIGTGTRWPAELAKLGHPANELYNEVREVIVGASCACAAVFGATESLAACGVPERKEGLHRPLAEGWQVLVF